MANQLHLGPGVDDVEHVVAPTRVHLVDRVRHRVAQEALDRGNPASRVTNGNENASVLPLPVLLLPNTSRPTRVSGKGLVLDREGVADAARVSASTSGWPTPKSAMVFLNCHASKDVFSMVALHAATLVANECKVARLPVVNVDRARKPRPLCTGEM